jgi:hypothetical protein
MTAIQNSRRLAHPSFVSGARDLFRCAQADKIIKSIAKNPIKHSVQEDMLKETVSIE